MSLLFALWMLFVDCSCGHGKLRSHFFYCSHMLRCYSPPQSFILTAPSRNLKGGARYLGISFFIYLTFISSFCYSKNRNCSITKRSKHNLLLSISYIIALNIYYSLGKFSNQQTEVLLLFFSPEKKIDFGISCKLSPNGTICKTCSGLFS